MHLVNQVEKQIFCRLANGETIKEIARAMHLHPRCVDYYVGGVKKRLQAKSTAQAAVKLALEGQLS